VPKPPSAPRFGLARALSKLGYCSRSQAAELIHGGRVRLNGRVCRNAKAPVRLAHDQIQVDGSVFRADAPVYLMLNKPRGVVTTASDEKGRATVYSCLPSGLRWVAPIGRLDQASEGLLLFTNDSQWGARITAPETHLEKTYHVQIDAVATEALCLSLESGVKDGKDTLRALRARILRLGKKNSWLEIGLDEGKNRQIRRMLASVDMQVLRLVRTAIGPLQLGELAKAACRPLTAAEKAALDREMNASSRR
jgi:23S rRNA pseudouridine2605 synthase